MGIDTADPNMKELVDVINKMRINCENKAKRYTVVSTNNPKGEKRLVKKVNKLIREFKKESNTKKKYVELKIKSFRTKKNFDFCFEKMSDGLVRIKINENNKFIKHLFDTSSVNEITKVLFSKFYDYEKK